MLRIKKTHIAVTISLAFLSTIAHAQETELGNIVVKGQKFLPEQSGFTANVVDQDTIRERQISQIQDLYREVPGMAVRNLGLGGVADNITMRGFADGGHGGDIGMAIDGIPLNETMSHADGYADQNVIVPLEIESMTVFKGPSSALYGNYNRGGTIAFESRKDGDYRELDVKAGSFGTVDAQAALGTPIGESAQGNFAAQFYRSDGFRQQSDMQRATLAGRIGFNLGGGTTLAVSGRAHQGTWDSASYITAAQNASSGRRFDKDPRVQNDGGEKNFYTGRIDLSTPINDDITLLAYVYGTQQTFTRIFTRPTSATLWEQRLEDYDRDVIGAGASLNGLNQLAGKKLNWIVGTEFVDESTQYIYKDGLNNRAETAVTTGGTKPYLNRKYTGQTVSAFGQAEWAIAPLFRPIVGVRYDRLSGDCNASNIEIKADPCQNMANYNHTSPKVGIRSTWSPKIDSRISFSEGFQLPPAAARYGSGGGALKPSVIRQYEVGLTLKPIKDVLIDVSAFRVNTTDEVRDIGGGVFENFGKTRRQGIELDTHYNVNKNLDLSAAITWVNTKVMQNPTASLVGLSIPGVPKQTSTVRGRYRFGTTGWSTDLTVQHSSQFAANADGSATNGSYTTTDLMVAYERKMSGQTQRIYVAVNNLFDRKYTTNSFMMGGMQMYAPAAPRTFMLGVSLNL